MNVSVHLLPELIGKTSLAGSAAVVIDILRAGTTICHALASGAERVVPCLTIADALGLRSGSGRVLLGGERGGVKIEGFELSNSPFDYTLEVVGGATIGFTTTNGTKALHRCADAELVLIGAFVNLTAVVACLREAGRPVQLVCAGTDGVVTAEDVLFAGAVVDALCESDANVELANDSARLALDFYRRNSQNEAQFRQALLDSQGGRNLQRLGYEKDIERAGTRDLFDFVPRWNRNTNAIDSPTKRD